MQSICAKITRVQKFDDHALVEVEPPCQDFSHDRMVAVFPRIDQMECAYSLANLQRIRGCRADGAVAIIDKPHIAFCALCKFKHLGFNYLKGYYSIERTTAYSDIYFATRHVVIVDLVFVAPAVIIQLITDIGLVHTIG
jgi:hypothetical protein